MIYERRSWFASDSVGGSGGPSSSSSSSSLPYASSLPFLVEETRVEGCESSTRPNDNVGNWPAWNKPSNGALELN